MVITEIFRDLQKIGCIEYCRNLEASEGVLNFSANSRNNKIEYNSKMDNIQNKNSIKFCLLHEEGHFRFPNRVFIPIFAFSFFTVVIMIFLLVSICKLEFILALVSLLTISFILIIWYKWIEEYESDKFASLMLRDVLKDSDTPSRILENALHDISSDKTICDIPITLLMTIIHPSHQCRIRKIARYIDKKSV
jgi:Zn-dependent protease with chaperone function